MFISKVLCNPDHVLYRFPSLVSTISRCYSLMMEYCPLSL